MKLTVLGLWHLGCVTAACCAERFNVCALDFDPDTVEKLGRAVPPIHEPGLQDLLKSGLSRGTLNFTADPQLACADAAILWVCYDTPVDEAERADGDLVPAPGSGCPGEPPAGPSGFRAARPAAGTRRARRLAGQPRVRLRHASRGL